MKYAHGVKIKPIFHVWKEEICSMTNGKKKFPRIAITKQLIPVIGDHMNLFEEGKRKTLKGEMQMIKIEEFIHLRS